MTVDRMKRRHPNIHNEILIEKRVRSFASSPLTSDYLYLSLSQTLNKLDHPNIVTLFATFQDYGTLYYQMEFLDGGEIWSFLQDEQSKASVGCYPSLARFWIAEAVNALEYMHRSEAAPSLPSSSSSLFQTRDCSSRCQT
jgi:serine/threonine protein kinase